MQITVRTHSDNHRRFAEYWWLALLGIEIVNSVPTSATAEYYAKITAEKAMLFRLIAADRVCQPYEASQPADEIIAQAEKGLIDVKVKMLIEADLRTLEMWLNVNFEIGSSSATNDRYYSGIATGYRDLDHDDRTS